MSNRFREATWRAVAFGRGLAYDGESDRRAILWEKAAMSEIRSRRIVLAARPEGAPKPSDFRLEEETLGAPGPGELLCRTHYFSLDPYMRGRMNATHGYTQPLALGETMIGAAVCEVLRANAPGFAAGDIVRTYSGWRDYALVPADGVERIDPSLAPVTTALGVLGMPGLTAYAGLLTVGKPRPGDTVVVAAASGPVGATVGQIARLMGCRAVGIAGTAAKCAHVTDDLGFDACVNHRDPGFAEALAAACPDGIDVYFENVGGAVLRAVIPLLNPFARVPVCGQIAHYNASAPPPGPDHLPMLMIAALTKRLTLRGFIVTDFADQEPEFLARVSRWIGEGKIVYREDMVDGIENAIDAFIGLLGGGNFGKLLVRLDKD